MDRAPVASPFLCSWEEELVRIHLIVYTKKWLLTMLSKKGQAEGFIGYVNGESIGRPCLSHGWNPDTHMILSRFSFHSHFLTPLLSLLSLFWDLSMCRQGLFSLVPSLYPWAWSPQERGILYLLGVFYVNLPEELSDPVDSVRLYHVPSPVRMWFWW